jgi:hypothetical protein
MGEARGMQGGHDKCLYGFGEEMLKKESVWEENIKIDFNVRCEEDSSGTK